MAITLQDVCLLLIFSIYTQAFDCDSDISCLGLRPRGVNGCCPLLNGDPCDIHGRLLCDEQLGYSCKNGSCQGKFNLTATKIGTTYVELTWTDFKPENYMYEYSIMFTTEYEQKLENWERHEFGIDPHATLRHLEADVWYYIKVGVWDDPWAFSFQNTTETLMVKTKASSSCLYYGSLVEVGETIIVECLESCTCLSNGRLRCVSVCPKADAKTPVCLELAGPEELCCDFVEQCISVSNCSYGGEHFSHGHTWLIGCLENCTCVDGIVSCFPVCPGGIDPSHCKEEDFRKSNEECCRIFLDCTRKENLSTTTPSISALKGARKTTHDPEIMKDSDKTFNKVTEGSIGRETESNTGPHSSQKDPVKTSTKENKITVSFRAVTVSSTFAVLQWLVPGRVRGLSNCSFVVKYRALSDHVWTYTKELETNTTQCVVKCLKFSSWYVAELVSVNESLVFGEVFFNTTKLLDTTAAEMRPKISTAKIKTKDIYIRWKLNTLWNKSDILYTEIFWTKAYSHAHDVLQVCVDKTTSDILIEKLTPDTMYVVWIGVILTHSRVIYSNQLQFVTTKLNDPSTSFHEHSKIIAIAISCTTVVILFFTFISVVYVIKYRRRRTMRRPETAFENKIFQIH